MKTTAPRTFLPAGNQPDDEQRSMRVLRIDAWGNAEEGYEWNDWNCIGRIPVDTPKEELLSAAHAAFIFTHPDLPDDLELVSDGFNMAIQERATGKPLYAFEGAGE